MHRPVIVETASKDNVNLYIYKTEESNFSKNVELDRKSSEYTNNVTSWIGDIIVTSVNTDDYSTLNIEIDQEDILITNEALKVNDEYYPLWYYHKVSEIVYNETLEPRSITGKLTPGKWYISNLIATESNVIIVKDTVTVYIVSKTSRTKLDSSDYIVDYINGRVYITSDIRRSEENNYFISYYILTPNVYIESDYNKGNIKFRPEYRFALGDNQKNMPSNSHARNLYKCDILVDKTNKPLFDDNDINNTYTVVYNSRRGGAVSERKEILKAYPIFNKTTSSPISRQYAISDNKIIVRSSPPSELYYTRNISKISEKIYASTSQTYIDELWYLNIKPEIVNQYNSGEYIKYNILEKNKYKFTSNNYRLVNVMNEKVEIANKNQVVLKNTDIFVDFDINRSIKNIELYNLRDNKIISSDHISDFDKDNGMLTLDINLSSKDSILATYTYKSKFIPYTNLQLNPSIRFSSTNKNNVHAYNHIIFVLPEEVLNTKYNRSIFHYSTIKNEMFIYDNEAYQVNYDAFIEWVNTYNETTGLSNVYSIVDKKYFSKKEEQYIKPMILANIATVNTSVASSIEYVDIRIKGGGLNPSYDIDQHYDWFVEDIRTISENEQVTMSPETLYDNFALAESGFTEEDAANLIYDYNIVNRPENNIDIAFIDGKPYPSNNVFIARIPMSYVYDYMNNYMRYIPSAVRYIRNHTKEESIGLLTNIAKETMKNTVTKFLPVSAEIIFEFLDTTQQTIDWLEEMYIDEE